VQLPSSGWVYGEGIGRRVSRWRSWNKDSIASIGQSSSREIFCTYKTVNKLTCHYSHWWTNFMNIPKDKKNYIINNSDPIWSELHSTYSYPSVGTINEKSRDVMLSVRNPQTCIFLINLNIDSFLFAVKFYSILSTSLYGKVKIDKVPFVYIIWTYLRAGLILFGWSLAVLGPYFSISGLFGCFWDFYLRLRLCSIYS
jgi:hypothetical protein